MGHTHTLLGRLRRVPKMLPSKKRNPWSFNPGGAGSRSICLWKGTSRTGPSAVATQTGGEYRIKHHLEEMTGPKTASAGESGPYYGSPMLVREGPNQVSLPDGLVLKLELVDVS